MLFRSEVEYIEGSVLDAGLVRNAVAGVDQVYHLAGLPGMWMPDREDFYRVNCVGTENVLAAARASRIRRFLHCSTESILFDYPGSMGAAAAETAPPAEAMPGAYTRSKALAEAAALVRPLSRFTWVSTLQRQAAPAPPASARGSQSVSQVPSPAAAPLMTPPGGGRCLRGPLGLHCPHCPCDPCGADGRPAPRRGAIVQAHVGTRR